MKDKLKIILTTVLFAIIICTSLVYAENETTENTTDANTNTTTTENTVTNTTNETTNTNDDEEVNENKTNTNATNSEEKKKSSNANLKNLGIKPNDFSGFKSGTTSYKSEVPNNVEKVEVYAQAQDPKAIITGIGNRKLEVGENELIVTVTAEDGTVKKYTIYVTRLAEEVTAGDNEEKEEGIEVQENELIEGNGLANIKIENAKIEPEFQTNIYEYQVKYIGEETELGIKAEPTDNTYIVEITGNENLQEGENIITILVSDKDYNNVATYQMTVNKKLVDEEAIAREKEELKKKLIIGGIIAIAIVIIVAIIIKRRKDKKEAEEYEVPFSGMNFNEDNSQDFNNLEEKEMSKEEIRRNYLENYDNEKNYENEKIEKRKVKAKGKRFK